MLHDHGWRVDAESQAKWIVFLLDQVKDSLSPSSQKDNKEYLIEGINDLKSFSRGTVQICLGVISTYPGPWGPWILNHECQVAEQHQRCNECEIRRQGLITGVLRMWQAPQGSEWNKRCPHDTFRQIWLQPCKGDSYQTIRWGQAFEEDVMGDQVKCCINVRQSRKNHFRAIIAPLKKNLGVEWDEFQWSDVLNQSK